MNPLLGLEDVGILVAAALVPALIYVSWIRAGEGPGREGWSPVLRAFAYGAFFATVTAALIELALVAGGTSFSTAYPAPEFVFLNGSTPAGVFFLALVIAPFVEEALKASGVVSYRSSIRTVADGPVLGASVGLGFGFFETLLYGLGAFATGGLVAGIELIVLRSLSSVVLHGSSTALFGYGYAEDVVRRSGRQSWNHYLGAVGLHSSFNAIVSLGAFASLLGLSGTAVDTATLLGLGLGVLLAFLAIEYIRRLIAQTAFPGALADHPRYRPPPVRVVQRAPTAPRAPGSR